MFLLIETIDHLILILSTQIVKELNSPTQIPGVDPAFQDVCYSGFERYVCIYVRLNN